MGREELMIKQMKKRNNWVRMKEKMTKQVKNETNTRIQKIQWNGM